MVPAPRQESRPTVGLYVLARDEEPCIERTVAELAPLVTAGFVDRFCVVDGGSTDRTASLARGAGAEVLLAADVLPETGPVLGKGDSLWRAAAQADEELLCFLDADIVGDLAGLALRLVDALRDSPRAQLVKGTFRRLTAPPGTPGAEPRRGGRITEHVVRPAFARLLPEFVHYREPLSGQVAVRRATLLDLPVTTGYGLEIGMLMDVVKRFGHDAVLEVPVGDIFNPPREDAHLQEASAQVETTLLSKAYRYGWAQTSHRARLHLAGGAPVERPPLSSLALRAADEA
ncbi:MAG: glycosyl transferase family 2 [Frankiales bacterium]|nr:glycosyl transferase family 2 [Frankiales bacterium]